MGSAFQGVCADRFCFARKGAAPGTAIDGEARTAPIHAKGRRSSSAALRDTLRENGHRVVGPLDEGCEGDYAVQGTDQA